MSKKGKTEEPEKKENIESEEKIENNEQEMEEVKEDIEAQVDEPTEKEEVKEEVNEVDALKAQVEEQNNKYLRLYSEYDNFRKRTAKEKIELIQTGGEDVFKSLIPIIDDFERANKSNAETTDIDTVIEGMQLIFNKFKNTLTQKGLSEMKSIGEPFDTDKHEAITNIPAPSEDMKGKVIDELEKGYTLNEKIIRFAKVVIGN